MLWEGMADRNPVGLAGSQQGTKSMRKGEVVTGREGEESRADLEESRYWMEAVAEFVSLNERP